MIYLIQFNIQNKLNQKLGSIDKEDDNSHSDENK